MNPIKGEVPLILSDGRAYTLVLDFDALIEAEGAYGKPLQKMMADASAGFIGAVRAMLFGALRRKHPMIALSDASGMFMSDSEAVTAALEQAALAAFPDAEDKELGKAPVVARRGKPSGSSGAKRA